ncbi:MAG: methyltransferase domain-containing protein [Pseudomonadota bacterium]
MPAGSTQQGTCLGVSFYRSRHACIRQLKKLHSPSTFGYRVWGSCWLLMDYLKTLGVPAGLRVMEVGCGWGLAGIFCARELGAEVTCVDYDEEVFHYLRLHAELNQVEVATLNKPFEELSTQDLEPVDLLIGADICFWDEMPANLLMLIERALACGVLRIIIADPGRSSFGDLAAICQADYGANLFTLSVRKPHIITGRLLVINNSPQARLNCA